MMEILVRRLYKKEGYTIGKLYLDGSYFCDTLEDKVREIAADGSGKIKGVTAILAGRYRVLLTMSPRFKRVLPYLQGVPHFEGVRIHAGNTAADTEGCIIVGKNKVRGAVVESRRYERELTSRLQRAVGDIYITIE